MRFARLCQYGAALIWAFACHADVRSTDGSTSWVSRCRTSADCSDRMACECGVCTNVCAMDAVCGGSHSACARAGSSAFNATCGGESTLAGVCLPKCPDEGCGAGRVCTRGLCTLSVVTEPPQDAGPTSDPPPETGGNAGAEPETGGATVIGTGGRASTVTETGGSATEIGTGGGSGAATDTGGRGTADAATDRYIGPLATCDSFDDPAYRNGPTISFRNDLLPMFGLSCVVSDCHSPRDHKAGLNLGYKCAYDASAKWKCTFPAFPDPSGDTTKPQPDDEATVAAIYAGLLAPAATVKGGLVKRVAPGDPANSFLVLSLADKQNSRGYLCQNLDPSHESNPPPCGVSMPQNQDSFCQGTYQQRFDAVVRWIAQGAKNN